MFCLYVVETHPKVARVTSSYQNRVDGGVEREKRDKEKGGKEEEEVDEEKEQGERDE